MRTRTDSFSSPSVRTDITVMNYVGACEGAGTTTYSHILDTNVSLRSEKTMVDVVTPNFRKRVANGEIINNAMDLEESESTSSIGTQNASIHIKRWNTTCNPDKFTYKKLTSIGTLDSEGWLLARGYDYVGLNSTDIEHLISLAVTKAWASVEDCDVGVLETIAEFRMTVTSLSLLLKRMANILRLLKDKKLLHLLRTEFTAKELADRYMELRYVIRPLIYDIAGFYRKLSDDRLKSGQRQTFRGWKSETVRNSDQLDYHPTNVWNGGLDSYHISILRSSITTVDVRAGVLCHVKSSSFLDRWGFDNVFETMWELTKFSFIVDWILNVGQCIAAHTPEVGLRALASWYVVNVDTYRFVTVLDATRTWSSIDGFYSLVSCGYSLSNVKMSSTTKHRYRIPNPRLDVLPTFNIKLDVFKLADLLIMIKQLLA